jgi:hypothetical protein
MLGYLAVFAVGLIVGANVGLVVFLMLLGGRIEERSWDQDANAGVFSGGRQLRLPLLGASAPGIAAGGPDLAGSSG